MNKLVSGLLNTLRQKYKLNFKAYNKELFWLVVKKEFIVIEKPIAR